MENFHAHKHIRGWQGINGQSVPWSIFISQSELVERNTFFRVHNSDAVLKATETLSGKSDSQSPPKRLSLITLYPLDPIQQITNCL